MKPLPPRTVTPELSVRLPASTLRRLLPPASTKLMLPVPPMVWLPCGAKMLLLPMLIVPFRVRPLTTRSMPVPEARSSVPLSVTPERTLLPLLNATSLPLPVVLIVPPVIVLPNWLITLSALTLITPPALLMLCPPATCSAALFGIAPAPTLSVPVLLVPPPPASVSRKASRLTLPALLRLRIDCAALTVTVLPTAIVALSAAPGTMPQLQSAAVAQLPLAGVQLQLAASACCAGKASRMARRLGLMTKWGAFVAMFLSSCNGRGRCGGVPDSTALLMDAISTFHA
ncbi:MAG: hypothetical protein FAZ92_00497 [Accumulibacter sp.]|nr:MAG: hypothetical protein FAZ92_00497 [Accumulibacter sp.]